MNQRAIEKNHMILNDILFFWITIEQDKINSIRKTRRKLSETLFFVFKYIFTCGK